MKIFAAIGVTLLVDNFLIGFLLLLLTFSLSKVFINLSVAKLDLKIRDKIGSPDKSGGSLFQISTGMRRRKVLRFNLL